jgi:Arabinose efflux permease
MAKVQGAASSDLREVSLYMMGGDIVISVTTNTVEQEKRQMRLTLASTIIGTALEWYDFYLYGTAAALVFNKLFFPQLSPLMGTLAAFTSYGIGFFIRPLGGLVFGHIGDRYGRRLVLVATLLLMGLSTVAIGLLPTFQAIGIWAPILLTLCRAVQGFGAGAEFSSAIVLSAERAPAKRRGLYSSFAGCGIAAGILLSAGVFNFVSQMPQDAFLDYGWRIPFLLSIVAIIIGMVIRLHVEESPVFKKLESQRAVEKAPLKLVWKYSKREFLVAFGARMAENTSGFFLQVWSISYIASLGVPNSVSLTAIMLGAGMGIFTIPVWGILSDKIGRKPVYMGGALLFGLGMFPFFWILNTKEPMYIIPALVVMICVANYSMFSVQAAYFSELFDSRYRVSGIAMSREFSAILAGGLAPVLCSGLLAWYGSYVPVAIYMVIIAAITVIALIFGPETKDKAFN